MNPILNRLRIVGIYEGISYLLLLFLAMPLKYFADIPAAVTYVGWIHGLLFVLFIIALVHVWFALRWSFKNVVLAFIASLVPLGTFYLDKKIRERELT